MWDEVERIIESRCSFRWLTGSLVGFARQTIHLIFTATCSTNGKTVEFSKIYGVRFLITK